MQLQQVGVLCAVEQFAWFAQQAVAAQPPLHAAADPLTAQPDGTLWCLLRRDDSVAAARKLALQPDH